MSNELPTGREQIESEMQEAIAEYQEQLRLSTSPDHDISYGPKYYINLTKSRLACAAHGLPQTLDTGAPFHSGWTPEDFQKVCTALSINYESAREYVEKEIERRTELGAGNENN